MNKILQIDKIIPVENLNSYEIIIFTHNFLTTFGLPVCLEYINNLKKIYPKVSFCVDCSSNYVMSINLIEKNINYLIIKRNTYADKMLQCLIKENNRDTVIFHTIKDFTKFISIGNL